MRKYKGARSLNLPQEKELGKVKINYNSLVKEVKLFECIVQK